MSSQAHKKLSPSPSPDLKTRVIACLNKLSDRDTLPMAATELESIAKNLSTAESFSSFITTLHNTDSNSKSPVRKQCVTLLSLLSLSHGNSLSPHLPKMISALLRRLRDPDSSVRTACIDAVAAMSANITDLPFSAVFKPLMDMLTVEQDANSQIGSAMCLAAAVEVAPEPEAEMLRKALPRLAKLIKSEGFKAKAAVLGLMGSIVGVEGVRNRGILDLVVKYFVEFLSSEDWASRKAAAEALGKVAEKEKETAGEYKKSCLITLENRRYDKVKVVRETMNRTLELWKEVPGDSHEVPSPSLSRSSSIDNGAGGCFPSVSRSSNVTGIRTPQLKKAVPANKSPPSDKSLLTTTPKESHIKSKSRKPGAGMLSRINQKKSPDWKVAIAVPQSPSTEAFEDDKKTSSFKLLESRENENCESFRPEAKRTLFGRFGDEKPCKFGGLRSGSRVVPLHDNDEAESVVTVNDATEEVYGNHEDLSLIRNQLVQIENQQSNLLEMLQKFIGSSQSGINSLETRVRDLEMALDEMSYDLAVSSGRFHCADSAENTCCKLPGAEFLSPKFWRRTEGRLSTSKFSSWGMQSQSSVNDISDKDEISEAHKSQSQIFRQQSRGGLIRKTSGDGHHDFEKLELNGKLGRTIYDSERTPVHKSRFGGSLPSARMSALSLGNRSSASNGN